MVSKRRLPDSCSSHETAGGPSAGNHGSGRISKKQGTLDRVLGLNPLPSYFVLSRVSGTEKAPSGASTGAPDAEQFLESGVDFFPRYSARWVGDNSAVAKGPAWRAEVVIGGRHVSLVMEEECAKHVEGIPADPLAKLSLCQQSWPQPSCTNVALLKSLLQKAIRRRNKRAATWAGFSLLELDPTALLRRLPIIMLEDAMLHDSLPAIVWMMAAHSKGWQPSLGHAVWLLNVVATLCEIPAWDIPGSDAEVLSDALLAHHWRGCEPQCSLLLSLKARLAFGGMACDLSMLRWEVNVWDGRFRTQAGLGYSQLPIAQHIQHLPVQALPLNGWILAACDFHCSNIVDRFLSEHQGVIRSPEELKSLMWQFSSSVNPREAAFNGHKPTGNEGDRRRWQAIQSHVYKVARAIIQKNLV